MEPAEDWTVVSQEGRPPTVLELAQRQKLRELHIIETALARERMTEEEAARAKWLEDHPLMTVGRLRAELAYYDQDIPVQFGASLSGEDDGFVRTIYQRTCGQAKRLMLCPGQD